MGRRSAKARIERWGAEEFKRRMKEWGKLGGRPKGSKKQHAVKGKAVAKKGGKA